MRVALGFLMVVAFGLLGTEGSARAFDPDGHEVVEALAYRDLIARAEVAGTSGRQIVSYLIRRGFLARPRCFDAKPDDPQCGDAARREQPVDFWPVLSSGSLDLLLSRQIGRRGQCFHFMADTGDLASHSEAPDAPVPEAMRVDALKRCLRLATSLFDEVVRDPYVASTRGRGTYALIHMLADSYSRAHVERAANGHIQHLRVWILRNDFLFDIHKFNPVLHHDIVDQRDKRFIDADRVVDGTPCGKVSAPYEVKPACLSSDGRAAVDTLVDLLVTLYLVEKHAGGGKAESAGGAAPPLNLESEQAKVRPHNPTSIDDPAVRARWQAFLERHFASDEVPLVIEKQREDEHGWQPNLLIAGVFRQDAGSDGQDAGLRMAWMQVVRQALPLIPLESVTLGYGSFGGRGRWLARAEMAFLAPIGNRFAFGFSPLTLGLTCARDVSDCRGDLLTLPARLSYFSDLGFWVDLTGPEYSWFNRLWSDRLGISVGAAFDIFDTHVPRHVRRGPAVSEGATADPPWSPPDMPERLRYRRPASVTFFVEGAVIDSDRDHELSVGGEIRAERDADNRRAGLGYGVELAYQSGRFDDRRLDDGRIVPSLRYYLIPSFLSIRATPLAFGVGKWGEDFFFDVGAEAEVTFALGGLEVGLAGPRISYTHWAQNGVNPLNLRFAWRWRD